MPSEVLNTASTVNTSGPENKTALIDTVSKLSALAFFGIYAAGYLVTSLHQAQFGIFQANPFRMRVLAAGTLYTVMVLAALAIAQAFRSKSNCQDRSFLHILFPLWVTCKIIVLVPNSFFQYEDLDNYGRWYWKILAPTLFLVAGILMPKFRKIPANLVLAVQFLAVLYFVPSAFYEAFFEHHFTRDSVSLWLFVIALISLVVTPKLETVTTFEGQANNPLIYILGSLLIFATHIYPHISAAWGGGSPVPVTIFFNSNIPDFVNGRASVFLLDETDAGLYVRGKVDDKATFIPRSGVTLMHFAENTSKSALFRK